MKRFIVPAAVLFLLAPAISKGSDMASPTGGGAVQDKTSQVISAAGSQPSIKGPAEYFTGSVRIDPLFSPKESASFSGGYVTFEPGARSAWIALTGTIDGKNVAWMEKVTEEQYRK